MKTERPKAEDYPDYDSWNYALTKWLNSPMTPDKKADKERIEREAHEFVSEWALSNPKKYLTKKRCYIAGATKWAKQVEELNRIKSEASETSSRGYVTIDGKDFYPAHIVQDLTAERDALLQWKKGHGIVESWWNEVGDYIQSQPSEGKIGWKLSDIALERLKERNRLITFFHKIKAAIDNQERERKKLKFIEQYVKELFNS